MSNVWNDKCNGSLHLSYKYIANNDLITVILKTSILTTNLLQVNSSAFFLFLQFCSQSLITCINLLPLSVNSNCSNKVITFMLLCHGYITTMYDQLSSLDTSCNNWRIKVFVACMWASTSAGSKEKDGLKGFNLNLLDDDVSHIFSC